MPRIPFIDLATQRRRLGAALDEAVMSVIDHGRYVMGPEVGELEWRLAEFTGTKHVISCSSGTDALLMPLMAWEIGSGDAVFVPSFTFAATAEAVALVGATPIFVDVCRDMFTMDVESLKGAIAVAKDRELKPAAVIPVGLFGLSPDFDAILPVAREEGLLVLDDAAQSFGATYKCVPIGRFGNATATSFFPAKPLGCYGDGGAVLTDSDDLARLLRSIRVHGKGNDKYDNVRIGLNARLDTIQAAVLIKKLEVFGDELKARQTIADRYNVGLDGIVRVPQLPAGHTSAWAQYTVITENREDLQRYLSEKGIPSVVYYSRPLHLQSAYADYPVAKGGNPNAEWLSTHVLSLPMHPYLGSDDIDMIIEAISEWR